MNIKKLMALLLSVFPAIALAHADDFFHIHSETSLVIVLTLILSVGLLLTKPLKRILLKIRHK